MKRMIPLMLTLGLISTGVFAKSKVEKRQVKQEKRIQIVPLSSLNSSLEMKTISRTKKRI